MSLHPLQNFFHTGHPIEKIGYHDLSAGFNEMGGCVCDRGALGTLKVYYTDSLKSPNAPIAVMLHGYRGQPDGPNNMIVADILQGKGFATAQVGFAGYDHYGQREALREADLATIPTNIEDVKLILEAIGPDREVILVANSASINVAVPAAADYSNVSHILAISPFPDIFPAIQAEMLSQDIVLTDDKPFFIPHDFDPKRFDSNLKISKSFFDAGQPLSLRDGAEYSKLAHKPRLISVRHANDSTVPMGKYGKSWVDEFMEFAAVHNMPEDLTVDGSSHKLTQELTDLLTWRVNELAQEFGLIPPDPVSTPQIVHLHRGL